MSQEDIHLEGFKKTIYFEHVLNTIAIEGNSATLVKTENSINKTLIYGLSILEYNEVLNMDLALSYVNHQLINLKKNNHFRYFRNA